jgi:hypothetical protein
MRALTVAVCAGAALASSCAGRPANARPATAADVSTDTRDEASLGLMEHHRFHHYGGSTLFVVMSLDTLAVAPATQGTVTQLRNELVGSMAPARTAEQALMTTLADGVAQGTVDTAKADADASQVSAAARAVHDGTGDTLNRLHATLATPERMALADKVEAHWAVWQRANADETGTRPDEHTHLADLSDALGLTVEQRDRVRVALAESLKAVPPLDAKAVDAQLRTFTTAFAGPSFDVRAMTAASDVDARMVGWAASHLAHFVEAMTPALNADQRDALAARLREHAAHDPTGEATP